MTTTATRSVVAEAKENYLARERAWKDEHDGSNRGLRSQLSREATSDGVKVEPMDVLSALQKVINAEDVNTVHFRPGSKASNFIHWMAGRSIEETPKRPAEEWSDDDTKASDGGDADSSTAPQEETPEVRAQAPAPRSDNNTAARTTTVNGQSASGLEAEILRPFAEAYAQVTKVFNPEYVDEVLGNGNFLETLRAFI